MTLRRSGTVAVLLVFAWLRQGEAQGYRLRLDTRLQTVSFRGVALDSIATADTVTGSGGGPATPDGFAVSCIPGRSFCHFYRPGPTLRGTPIVTSADLTLWGLGVTGLSARLSARAAGELRDARIWPGTSPRFQLIEGYVEYAPNPAHRRSHLVRLTRAGRGLVAQMDRREHEVMNGLRVNVSQRELTSAARTLRRVRGALESAAWRESPRPQRAPRGEVT